MRPIPELENAMSISRIRTTLAIAFLAAPALLAVQPASAGEQYVFASVKHIPDWQVDSGVQAATRACDPSGRQAYETAVFKKCMLHLGWRYTHVRRFASHRPSAAQHERELDKKNQDEALWAQQQREEQARNDETTANAIAAAQASANQSNP
jgi:hypothetical protein